MKKKLVFNICLIGVLFFSIFSISSADQIIIGSAEVGTVTYTKKVYHPLGGGYYYIVEVTVTEECCVASQPINGCNKSAFDPQCPPPVYPTYD
ncbi:MAG: hypothetical protein J7L77_07495 [Clostridiales bacterium]|nr:hypothetical protein [Clostridiales bacterium]